jgi:3-phenylpropionate/cinnamic acid dioxygenase small subunit
MTTTETPRLTRTAAEELLYDEADLLDDREFERWLDLFTDDAVYWVPARPGPADPDRHVSLIYDDRARMADRVWRLTVGPAHAQIPPSATRRLITNVRVAPTGDGDVLIRSNFAIYEVRKGVQRDFAGRYEHLVTPHGDGWRIRSKTVRLVNCDAPIFNLTFML